MHAHGQFWSLYKCVTIKFAMISTFLNTHLPQRIHSMTHRHEKSNYSANVRTKYVPNDSNFADSTFDSPIYVHV